MGWQTVMSMGPPPSEKLEKDIKDELLEPLPNAPQMNCFIIRSEKKDKLHLPSSLANQGKEFIQWLDKLMETPTFQYRRPG